MNPLLWLGILDAALVVVVAVLAALNLASEHEERREAWLARARAVGQRARRLEESLLQLAAAIEPIDEPRG